MLYASVLEPTPGIFRLDHALLLLYEQPMRAMYPIVMWMVLWSIITVITLGIFRTSVGKWALGLSVHRRNGRRIWGMGALGRILAAWTVPLTLGLSYLWMIVSPERRGWHDSLSGTFVVQLKKPSE